MRALIYLKNSPMAMDIYSFLTYRVSYLSKPTTISWKARHAQFGAEYSLQRQFKAAFINSLKTFYKIYDKLNVDINERGIYLCPSLTHVPKNVTDVECSKK